MFDRQTKKFAAAIIDALPEVPEAVMQRWIQNPKSLQGTLRRGLCPPRWEECQNSGAIYFNVISDGTDGPKWKKRITEKGGMVGGLALDLLESPAFVPTSGIVTKVAILSKGRTHINDHPFWEAEKRRLRKVNPEVACLILDSLLDGELEGMGYEWIVAMHDPISAHNGHRHLLFVRCDRRNGYSLDSHAVGDDYKWLRGDGFAFADPAK